MTKRREFPIFALELNLEAVFRRIGSPFRLSSGRYFLLNPLAKLGIFPELPNIFREISHIFPKSGTP